MPILIIDVETTGLDYRRHACIELGGVILDSNLSIARSFGSLIKLPISSDVDPRALDANKIGLSELETAPSIIEVVDAFSEFVSPDPAQLRIAGWNVWFDVMFVRSLYETSGRPWPFGHRHLDVQSVVSFWRGLEPISQASAIKETFNEIQTHRALSDAIHTARLLKHFHALRRGGFSDQ